MVTAALWLFWKRLKDAPLILTRSASENELGWVLFFGGCCIYALGRSQSFSFLEVLAAAPISAGAITLLYGFSGLNKAKFAIFFLFFLLPFPGTLIDIVTQPLKVAVSIAAEEVLYSFGYPVSRAGVILGIGQYQLLVADACAGINSLFLLEAFGLLYLNVVRHESVLRNVIIALLIFPISFVSNTIRVVVLALISFHIGDSAAQGFLHDFSGILLFLTALLLVVAVDALIRIIGQYARHHPRMPT